MRACVCARDVIVSSPLLSLFTVNDLGFCSVIWSTVCVWVCGWVSVRVWVIELHHDSLEYDVALSFIRSD